MKTGTVRALVGCQIDDCATETSYYLDQVRFFEGRPICEDCWVEEAIDTELSWSDLPPVKLKDLYA